MYCKDVRMGCGWDEVWMGCVDGMRCGWDEVWMG